jgi:quercetin dioxygenase-like cupin family protein
MERKARMSFKHAGDVVFILREVPHWYRNIGEENFKFLCIIPKKPDEIKIIDKGC